MAASVGALTITSTVSSDRLTRPSRGPQASLGGSYMRVDNSSPLYSEDDEILDNEYKYMVEDWRIDKKKIRKHLTSGTVVPGATISKVKRVRRS